MIMGISIPWYQYGMTAYGTAINTIPANMWMIVKRVMTDG